MKDTRIVFICENFEQKLAFKAKAARNGKTMSVVLNEFVNNYTNGGRLTKKQAAELAKNERW